MSKTKSLQKKTTGFDIVYRVVTVVLAVVMYPLFYFWDMIYVQIDHKTISDLIGSLTQAEKPNLEVTYESVSLYEFGDWMQIFQSLAGENSEPINLWTNAHFRPLLFAIIFIAIALVLGLVIIGFAAFTNKVKVVLGLSVAGFVSSVISFFCFSEGFAAPIVDGTVSLSTLFGQDSATLSSILLGAVGEVSQLSLEGGFFSVLFLMLGICIWSLSVHIVNAGEEKENEAKRLAKQRKK